MAMEINGSYGSAQTSYLERLKEEQYSGQNQQGRGIKGRTGGEDACAGRVYQQ